MITSSIPEGKKFLPDVTMQQLRGIKKKEKSERYKRHYTAAIRRKEGLSIREIADDVNMSIATIAIWLHNMMSRGVGESYKVKQGRPPKFTPEQLNELSVDMRESPSKYGLDYTSWASHVVTQYVLQKFDVSITPGSMRRILVRKDIDWPGSAKAMRAKREAKKTLK